MIVKKKILSLRHLLCSSSTFNHFIASSLCCSCTACDSAFNRYTTTTTTTVLYYCYYCQRCVFASSHMGGIFLLFSILLYTKFAIDFFSVFSRLLFPFCLSLSLSLALSHTHTLTHTSIHTYIQLYVQSKIRRRVHY